MAYLFPHVLKPSTPDLADRGSSGLDFLPLLEVVRQLQRTKIRQLRMGDEEVEWVSKEVSSGGNCKGLRRPQCICWILFGHFRKSSRSILSRSIRKSHPLWDIVAVLPKKMLWEQGNTIEPCRHWLCDEMEKIIAACITCADFKALLSSRPESVVFLPLHFISFFPKRVLCVIVFFPYIWKSSQSHILY